MKTTTARRIGVVVGLAILVGAFALFQLFSQMKEEPPRREIPKSTPTVETMPVVNSTIPTALSIQGELVAYNKIDIFSEVTGTLESSERPFKVGSYFPKGSVLVEINDREARLSLLSQKATLLNAITQLMPDLKIDYPESYNQWHTYLKNYDVEEELDSFPEPLNDQEKYFIASRNLYTQYYTIKSAEERLDKYTMYAPFSGVLTQASINTGTLVRVGQQLGTLMNTGSYELQATVALSDLTYIKVGNQVQLTSDDIKGTWTGRIRRISDQIDPTSQTVQIFVSVGGQGLREGMYLTGEVNATDIEDAVRIPRNKLINQNAVYTVQDSTLKLQPVEVVKITREAAVVRGLPNGTNLLDTQLPNAFDGMKVKVSGPNRQEAGGNLNQTVGNLE
jgi:membrane fusion protein, multidrug efflux system